MNVSCPECRSVFRIDPSKVPHAGVRARCNVCGAVIAIAGTAAEVSDAMPHDAAIDRAMMSAAIDPFRDLESAEAARSVATPGGATPLGTERDAESVGSPAVRARPVNPYLNNTPELRARRLARALVSDLVAYNPQKREQGLRDGTLRQLFREEIRKSWDEYVEQVGATVAESTPHFQDALNDVLAGGRRVF